MAVSRSRRGLTIVEFLIVLAILGCVVALLMPATRSARPAARRTQCLHNLKMLSLAMHNYEETFGCLPPAMTTDATGQPLHSWRTLLLPYLDESSLYDSIDLTKPWDAPENAHARKMSLPVFRCPESSTSGENTENGPASTTYLAIVGPNAALLPNRGRQLAEVTDGIAKTISIVEVPADKAVPWMKPDDLSIETFQQISTAEPSHRGGYQCVKLDGSASHLSSETDFSAAATVAGGEENNPFD